MHIYYSKVQYLSKCTYLLSITADRDTVLACYLC